MKDIQFIDSNMFTPKDSWDLLSMAEKSEMMKVAVRNGITKLQEIREKYNEFAEGGDKETPRPVTTGGAGYIPPVVSGPNAAQAGTLKDIAYRIMSQSSAENRGLGHIAKGVLESIAGQPYDQMYTGSFSGGNDDMEPDTTRDLNHLIVYGNTKGQYQPKELRGFDYSNYLQKNYGVNTMPTYEGRIVMANKVNIPTEYSPLVEWLSDRPKYGYYVDPDKDADVIQDWDNLPFLTVDDTASYRRSFRRDKSGKPELANQDLIDYGGKDYGRKYGTLAGLQGAVLNRVINSPVILDQGLSVNFTNNPEDFEQGEGWYNTLKSIVDRNHILQDNGNGNYSYPLVLPDINVFGRKRAEGGNLFGGGGYKPSDSVKKRISTWEGAAMTGAVDPLSGKWGKNRSFESEAVAFTRALPESIREQVLSNPELADNLFSYSYNVGAPKFKKRVVKALEDYYAGKGTAKKIADSMWASGDAKLRGLRNRRAEEKQGVMNALKVVPHTITEQPVSTAVVNPFILPAENTTFFPQVTPVEDNYVEVQEITPEQRRAEQVRNAFDAINSYNRMMDMLSVPNNPAPVYRPKNAPYVVMGLGGPIVEAAMNEYKKGGGIHIKHPGRLTALKKRTGKTEAELYNDGNPAHKKMVVFARNARRWKHGLGGELNNYNYGNTFGGGGLFGNETVDTVASFLPILGTAEDAYQFYQDPSWSNAGWLALSLGSDIFTGGMASRAIKAMRAANKAVDAANAANKTARRTWEAGKAANTAQSGSVRGADMKRMINSVKAAGATRQAAIRRADDALIDAGIKVGVDQGFNTFLNTTQNDMLPTFGLQQEQKHGLGGNLFSGEEEGSQQMNIFRRPNGEYFYQASPNSEEVSVTPLNTLFDNPALWTYTDNNGKLYTPRQAVTPTQDTITQKEEEGPIVEAARKYFGELQYDINNGIPIGGKYTLPAIAASALLPIAGEAFAGTTIAGVPATTWANTALTAGFAGHGLNHAINEGIDGWGDAAMTALEVAPLGRLAKPIAKETALAIENYRYPLGRPQVPEGFGSTSTFTFGDLGDKTGHYIHVGTPKNKVWVSKDKTWPELSELGENSKGVPLYQIDSKAYDARFGEPTLVDYEGNSLGIPISKGSWEEPNSIFRGFPQAIISKEQMMQVPHIKTTRNPVTGLWERELYQPERTVFPEETLTVEWPIGRTTPKITAENAASYAPKVNWDADNWFKTISGRGSYSSEEAAELASHVPEYRAIEQRLFDEGKLALDSNGNIIVVGSEMSPQEYIMRQSKAFQKMNPEHHYVGVSKGLRHNFENEARDPNTINRYEVWTDRKSPKNVEEYAISQQGGYTNDSQIETIEHQMAIREENHELHKEQLKWKLDHGKISQENYDRDLAALEDMYNWKQKVAEDELKVLRQQKALDPLNGGKVFDVTYPKETAETPIINAENSHWARIPFDNVVRDAPSVVTHYKQRPYSNELQTDQIVSGARRNGYGVTHIDNVMDTYDGTMLNETIIGRDTPVKSVLGNTGAFDIEGPNKWRLYRSLLPPFLSLGTLGSLYGTSNR